MQINDNIKLIRELSGWTQLRIAPYFGVKVTTWKSYENTDIRPKAKLLAALAKFAGIEMADLDNKLKPDDIRFADRKDRKVQEQDGNGSNLNERQPLRYDGSLTIQDYIDEKEARRKESVARAERAELEKDKLFKLIESNLGYIMGRADSLENDLISGREVVLKSLARLERMEDDNELLAEADNLRKLRAEAKAESYRKAAGGK